MTDLDSFSPLLASRPLNLSQSSRSALSATLGSGKFGPMSPEKAMAVAKDFESMFIAQMLEQMFGESSGSEAFGDKETDEVYKNLLMEQYGKIITRSGGIGIASYVNRELLKQQEVGS